MKRKSLIEAVSPAARDFIEAGTPKPQFVQAKPEEMEGEESSAALVAEPPVKTVIASQKRQKSPFPRQSRSYTYTNPQAKFHYQSWYPRRFDCHSGFLRTWRAQQSSARSKGGNLGRNRIIVAEAIKKWLRKHVSK
jgi:hypothetical protein